MEGATSTSSSTVAAAEPEPALSMILHPGFRSWDDALDWIKHRATAKELEFTIPFPRRSETLPVASLDPCDRLPFRVSFAALVEHHTFGGLRSENAVRRKPCSFVQTDDGLAIIRRRIDGTDDDTRHFGGRWSPTNADPLKWHQSIDAMLSLQISDGKGWALPPTMPLLDGARLETPTLDDADAAAAADAALCEEVQTIQSTLSTYPPVEMSDEEALDCATTAQAYSARAKARECAAYVTFNAALLELGDAQIAEAMATVLGAPPPPGFAFIECDAGAADQPWSASVADCGPGPGDLDRTLSRAYQPGDVGGALAAWIQHKLNFPIARTHPKYYLVPQCFIIFESPSRTRGRIAVAHLALASASMRIAERGGRATTLLGECFRASTMILRHIDLALNGRPRVFEPWSPPSPEKRAEAEAEAEAGQEEVYSSEEEEEEDSSSDDGAAASAVTTCKPAADIDPRKEQLLLMRAAQARRNDAVIRSPLFSLPNTGAACEKDGAKAFNGYMKWARSIGVTKLSVVIDRIDQTHGDNWCFEHDTLVELQGSRTTEAAALVPIQEIHAGDFVRVAAFDAARAAVDDADVGGEGKSHRFARVVATVISEVLTPVPMAMIPCVSGGGSVGITADHPVLINRVWQLPRAAPGATVKVRVPARCVVYNLMLGDGHVLCVWPPQHGNDDDDGGHSDVAAPLLAITLAHGVQNNAALTHPFWGADADGVGASLRQRADWPNVVIAAARDE